MSNSVVIGFDSAGNPIWGSPQSQVALANSGGLQPGASGDTTLGASPIPPTQAPSSSAPVPSTNATSNLPSTGSSNLLGTGSMQMLPYGINSGAITGAPINPDGNYGLNNVWNNLANASANLGVNNFNASAPSMTGTTGTAAQGGASTYNAATAAPATYSAGSAGAAGYNAAQAQAGGYTGALGNASSYQGALGSSSGYTAAQIAAAQAQASQGQASLAAGYSQMSPSAMAAARQGYATSGQTGVSTAGDAQWQAAQAQLANTLQTQASGGGVSPADLQLAAGGQQALNNQLAALGSQAGGTQNAALAMRSAADQAAAVNATTNQQMGVQRAQETLAAQQALGTVEGTARGQSQTYNANAAQLAQANNIYNAGNAQSSLTNNASLAQQGNLTNAQLSAQAAASNQSAGNQFTEFNSGAQNAMTMQNMANLQQGAQYNASNSQQAASLNQAGLNAANSFNAANQQQMTLANQNSLNNANAYNANAGQAMTALNMGSVNAANQYDSAAQNAQILANQNALNAASSYNAGNLQQAGEFNAGLSTTAAAANASNLQQAGEFNAGSTNAANVYNAGNTQAMTLANMGALNTQTLANQNALQSASAANLGQAGTYGLANQSSALAAQQQYYNQQLALAGAQTGISQSNRAAQLANEQLAVQQQTSENQTAAQAFAAQQSNQQNATGAIAGGVASAGATAARAISGLGTNTTGTNNGPVNQVGAASNSQTTLPSPETASQSGGAGPLNSGLGDYTSDPLGGEQTLSQYYPTISDENLKEGVSGGNPMLQSFMQQLEQNNVQDPDNINTQAGLGFQDPKFQKVVTPGNNGSSQNPNILGPILGVFGNLILPGAGGVIGNAAGTALNSIGQEGTPATSRNVEASAGSGDTAFGNISDDDSPQAPGQPGANPFDTTLSDDQAKENVQSGNQGMQAFLQQAGAQQQAQGSQGSTNNAFMQIGQSPNPVVDRPAVQNPNAGYGAIVSNPNQGFAGQNASGGYANAGFQGASGITQGGVTQGGGWSGAGLTSQGGEYNGGITSSGGYNPGGMASMGGQYQGGVTSQGGAYGGGYSGASYGGGGYSGGGYSGGSVTNQGGIAQQSSNYSPVYTPPNMPAPPSAFNQQTSQPIGAYANNVALELPQQQSSVNPQQMSQPATYAPSNPFFAAQPMSAFAQQISQQPTFSALSDEREKSETDDNGLQAFLDSVHAHQYRYKDPDMPGAGHGTFVSPMAQEIESTDLGKNFVQRGTDGYKRVDYGKMAGTMLAGQAMLNERLNDLESFLKAAK